MKHLLAYLIVVISLGLTFNVKADLIVACIDESNYKSNYTTRDHPTIYIKGSYSIKKKKFPVNMFHTSVSVL